MGKVRWDVTQLSDAVKNSECLSDVCKLINLERRGRAYDALRVEIQKQNLDTSHFKTVAELVRQRCNKPKWTVETALVENSNASTKSIKRIIHQNKLLIDSCSICGLADSWNNKPIVLQLDHIDGNHKNNVLSNLRYLCPNCHSQTDTFAGKKSKLPTKAKLNPNWRTAPKLSRRKVERPTLDELQTLLETHSMVKVGNMFGVSDNAVRKWIKKYNAVLV